MRSGRLGGVALALVVAGCAPRVVVQQGGGPANPVKADPKPAEPVVTADEARQQDLDWDCQKAVPPPGGYEAETAWVDAGQPQAVERAFQRAFDQLVANRCEGGRSCEALRALATRWKWGRGGGQVCAMATIHAPDLSWYRGMVSTKLFETSLRESAGALVGPNAAKKPRVAIDCIEDAGACGGPRVSWLQDYLVRALADRGAMVVDVPKGWGGAGLPNGVDLLLTGRVTPRVERRIPIFDLTWTARYREGGTVAQRGAPPVALAAAVAPAVQDVVAPLPEGDGKLALRLDAQRGGSLCAGERTQLWLTTDQDLHVRVFDLYGRDGAILVFPNAEQPNGLVRGGREEPLGGPQGFEAVPVAGSDVERFLVVAAPTEAGLGALAAVTETCRVAPDRAAALHRGEGLPPGVRVASTSFRLVTDGCPAPPPAGTREGVAASLEQLPTCP